MLISTCGFVKFQTDEERVASYEIRIPDLEVLAKNSTKDEKMNASMTQSLESVTDKFDLLTSNCQEKRTNYDILSLHWKSLNDVRSKLNPILENAEQALKSEDDELPTCQDDVKSLHSKYQVIYFSPAAYDSISMRMSIRSFFAVGQK